MEERLDPAALGLERGKVRLIPYQSNWPELFEIEATRIRHLAGPTIRSIEHVGSTAIPGIDSKPIVDIMASVANMPDAVALIPALELNGYEFRPEDSWPERIFLANGPRTSRTHHLSLTVESSVFWTEHLLFRNRLRSNEADASAYCALKKELAHSFPENRRAYTAAKEAFVMQLLSKARNPTHRST